MNTEFEDLVRDSMSRFTDKVTVPADLADRARRHVRSQRRARTGLLAAAAAVGATAVVVAATIGFARPSQPGPGRNVQARLTAEVINHVVRALTKISAKLVEYQRWSTRTLTYNQAPTEHKGPSCYRPSPSSPHTRICGTGTMFRVASGVDWYRDGVLNSRVYSPRGRLIMASRQVTGPRTSTTTTINYPERLWTRRTDPVDGPPLTRPVTRCVLDVEYWTPKQWARQMKALLGCSNVQVQGRQWVNGVDAIRIQTHYKKVRQCGTVLAGADRRRIHRCGWGIAGYAGTLLIDPSSYLPIRFESNDKADRIDFGFLPPTKANVAMLRLRIPRGFEHV